MAQTAAKNKKDTTSWVINVQTMHLNNGVFGSETLTDPPSIPGLFDGGHIYFSSITGDLKNIQVIGDTLTTDLQLSAKERSGLLVKKNTNKILSLVPS